MSVSTQESQKVLELLTCRPVNVDRHSLASLNSVPVPVAPLKFRNSSRGRLNVLVADIFNQILQSLDFHTLSNLRGTCYECKVAVDELREYAQVVKHAYETLRTLRSTGTIGLHSSRSLCQKLTSSKCETCNEYGPYLSLLTGDRCCFSCVNTKLRFRLVLDTNFHGFFGISAPKELHSLDATEATSYEYWDTFSYTGGRDYLHVPGNSTTLPVKSRVFVRLEEVLQCTAAAHGGWEELLAAIEKARRPYLASILWDIEREIPEDEIFEVSPFFQPWASLFGAAAFPSLDLTTRKVEKGVWCRGCVGEERAAGPYEPLDAALFARDTTYDIRQAWEERTHWLCLNDECMRAFSEDEFLRVHFKTCKDAQDLWKELTEDDKQ